MSLCSHQQHDDLEQAFDDVFKSCQAEYFEWARTEAIGCFKKLSRDPTDIFQPQEWEIAPVTDPLRPCALESGSDATNMDVTMDSLRIHVTKSAFFPGCFPYESCGYLWQNILKLDCFTEAFDPFSDDPTVPNDVKAAFQASFQDGHWYDKPNIDPICMKLLQINSTTGC